MNQGCMDVLKQPIVSPALSAGLRDHCVRLREALPRTMAAQSPLRTIAQILDDASRAGDLKAWRQALEEVRPLATELTGLLALAGEEPPVRRATNPPTRNIGRRRSWIESMPRWQSCARSCRSSTHRLQRGDDEAITAWLRELEESGGSPASARPHGRSLRWPGAERTRLPDLVRHALSGTVGQPRPRSRADCHGLATRPESWLPIFRAWRLGRRPSAGDRFYVPVRWPPQAARVGYSVDSGELDSSCYGLLASEARTAVFLAIAKHDIPRDAWFHLGRKLTVVSGIPGRCSRGAARCSSTRCRRSS